jgi:hypothetical protein
MDHCRECDEIGWRFMLYFTVHSCSKIEENRGLSNIGLKNMLSLNLVALGLTLDCSNLGW